MYIDRLSISSNSKNVRISIATINGGACQINTCLVKLFCCRSIEVGFIGHEEKRGKYRHPWRGEGEKKGNRKGGKKGGREGRKEKRRAGREEIVGQGEEREMWEGRENGGRKERRAERRDRKGVEKRGWEWSREGGSEVERKGGKERGTERHIFMGKEIKTSELMTNIFSRRQIFCFTRRLPVIGLILRLR